MGSPKKKLVTKKEVGNQKNNWSPKNKTGHQKQLVTKK